ncbi:nuclear poly(A) polymerase 4-like [Gossypium australe]|uniref:Nuclear poly(A) polymerase 4-like n=1 Tax=Gossypium australe TaxID=47621 RepID=A0A5B6X7W9_9ROSI|nr:nuclear poly(A) polymerase 4-like [Gossypium australe]
MGEPVRQQLLSPSEVPDSEARVIYRPGLNGKMGDFASAYMDNEEIGSSMRLLNWKSGDVGVDQEVVKPCDQTAVVETAESVCGSSSNVQNLNCGVSFRDLDSLLENGHLNAGVVFLNNLSEGLKVLNSTSGHNLLINLLTGAYVVAGPAPPSYVLYVAVTKFANSQDGASWLSLKSMAQCTVDGALGESLYTVVAAYLAIRIHSLAVLFRRNVLCGFSLEEQRNFMNAGVLKTRLNLIFASLERCGTLASIY